MCCHSYRGCPPTVSKWQRGVAWKDCESFATLRHRRLWSVRIVAGEVKHILYSSGRTAVKGDRGRPEAFRRARTGSAGLVKIMARKKVMLVSAGVLQRQCRRERREIYSRRYRSTPLVWAQVFSYGFRNPSMWPPLQRSYNLRGRSCCTWDI